jgi:hypothetical protein
MTAPDRRITRDDIQSKLEELRGEVDEGVERARNVTQVVAVVAVGVLIAAAFFYGRRRGR